MKKFVRLSILAILSVLCLTGCGRASASTLICDKFELVTSINGSTLELSLNTDLPSDAVISVTVQRSYWEEGNSEEYARSHFEKESTVAEWRESQEIDISSAGWKQNLKDFQSEMTEATLGFEVARISDEIEVRIVAPINGQTNPAFGNWNKNLKGKAVTIENYGRLVEAKTKLNYPL